ncbi:ABC transporter ATP-binding protein [Sphingomonas oligoaromativorans]|uniref:ABC transporter ATP-binding protein n=1 Tax=Sphingomonas oligoaromativorans TaxID=575322 RepID=UPI001FB95869|nr:ABC transporter ATP-binding protein [Sphingomonas oligoaromativorans]
MTRGTLAGVWRLLAAAPIPRWATPVLVLLGLISSLAETLGITLVVLFFYSATGQADHAASANGMAGGMLRHAAGWFGSSTQMALLILLLIVARASLSFLHGMLSARISERTSEDVRNRVHRQYLSVSYPFIQRHEQAHLMHVLGTETWMVSSAHGHLTRIVVNICSILVFTAALLSLSWQITLTAIVGSLLVSFGLRHLSRSVHHLGRHVKYVHQLLGEHMLMTLQGMRTIRAYGQEAMHQERFEHASGDARQTAIALYRLMAQLHPLTELGSIAVLCVIIGMAGVWHVGFPVTLAAIALLYRLQPHLRDLEGNLLGLAQIEPQLASVRAMLTTEGKDYPPPGHRPIDRLGSSIRFENVSFAYDSVGDAALTEVSFEIPAGKTTALVGASGAGKTTIVNLLLRLYQPTEGRILVDGVPLDEIRRTDWLGLLAIAGQDVDLVEGTVIDNIRMANHGSSDDEVRAALRVAGVADTIAQLPDGYKTWIGQQGTRFSGGQRQRLGLARAILRDPDVLILDEAMSALDKSLEDNIRHAIDRRFVGRTRLIITHRTETLDDVDHVVCLDQGKLVAEGPPEAVLLRSALCIIA